LGGSTHRKPINANARVKFRRTVQTRAFDLLKVVFQPAHATARGWPHRGPGAQRFLFPV